MNSRFHLKFSWVLMIALFSGIIQYAPTMLNAAKLNTAVLWQLDDYAMNDAGVFRYLKDGFLFGFATLWVLGLNRYFKGYVNEYSIYFGVWFFAIFAVGALPYVFLDSPLFLYTAGVRWLVLLYVGLCIFTAASNLSDDVNQVHQIQIFFFSLTLIDLILALYQVSMVSSLIGVAVGASRVPGLFSNAGVAGAFAVSVACFMMFLIQGSSKIRILIVAMCLLIALTSGTRYAMICVFVFLMVMIFSEIRYFELKQTRYLFYLLIAMTGLLASYFLFKIMIQVVDRGDMFATQFETGGRISNFFIMLDEILSSSLSYILIGSGLGVGTNTAFSMMMSRGYNPEMVKFNNLIDNSFLTNFFQFGLLGSIVFWFGVALFLLHVYRVVDSRFTFQFWAAIFAFLVIVLGGNPFEQYFIMILFLAAFGLAYWSSCYSSQMNDSLIKFPNSI